jgi:hypothetical protein
MQIDIPLLFELADAQCPRHFQVQHPPLPLTTKATKTSNNKTESDNDIHSNNLM